MTGKVRRLGLGPVKGNAARLFWAGDGDELAIGEGVEDALAVHAMFGFPTWAALNKGNMAELIVPPRFRRVRIFADRDADDGGVRAAHQLADRLIAEGRSARVLHSIHGKDPNDLLLTGEGR
jgi:putative DNA primase/helicase